MNRWKQVLAAAGSAALLVSNLGIVPQMVYAAETTQESVVETVEETEVESGETEVESGETEVEESEEESTEETKVESEEESEAEVEEEQTEENSEEETEEKSEESTEEETEETEETTEDEAKEETVEENSEETTQESKETTEETAPEVETETPETESEEIVEIEEVTEDVESLGTAIKDEDNEIEIQSITLEDTKDGYLTAKFEDADGNDITDKVVAEAEKDDGTLTFTWSRDDGKSVSNAALDSDANKINVSEDNGSQVTYSLNVKDADEVAAEEDGVTSNELKVNYYSELKNGDFEFPVIESTRDGYDSSLASYITGHDSKYAYVNADVPGIVWKTTATDKQFEIGQYNYGNAHQAYKDIYDDSVGEQYTELNATKAGSTYQDVLTYGDADLSWSLLHRASNTKNGTDKMYVVLMSTTDAEKALTAFKGNEQNSLKAMMEAVLLSDNGGAGVTTAYDLDQKAVGTGDNSVDVTVWKIATHTETNGTENGVQKYKSSKGSMTDGSADGIEGIYSDETGWASYTGSYTVPEGQYLTRFFFLSGETEANRGNLLDEVSFQQVVKKNASGKIKWVGDDETTRPDPEDVKITTIVDGKTYTATVTVKNGKWTYEFEDLPMNDEDGAPIHYDIKTTVEDYTTDVDENGKITYTYNPKVTNDIEWNDGDGTGRPTDPEDVKITTVVDGKTYTATVTVDKDGNWSYTFDDLPKYDEDGKEIDYTIKTEIDGYTADVDEDGKVTYTKIADVSGKLTWVDNSNADGTRPETVTVKVTDSKGNVYTKEVKVPADGSEVEYSFDDLPQYDEDGKEITYSLTSVITEDGSEYEVSYDENGTDATLALTGTTKAEGAITWVDGNNAEGTRPESLTITVKGSDGKEYKQTIKPDADGNWTYSIDDLPKYDENGKAIEYTLTKFSTGDNDYEVELDGKGNATCTLEGETEITGTLKWDDDDDNDGKRPESVTVNVYDNNGKLVASKVVSEENGWDYTFEDLPKYDEDGNVIEYSMTATSVDGYTSKITGSAEEGFVITNSYTPQNTQISGAITWDDDNDSDEKRPDSITIKIYDEDGNVVATKTITAEDGWTYSVEDLPRYKDGKEIQYMIKAVSADGYEMTIDGPDITYKHEVKKAESHKTESKKHDGGKYAAVDFYLVDDATTKPLASGTFALYKANGELVGTYTTDANGYIAFPNLKGGTYYLQQISAPDGYNVNATKLSFTVDGTNLALMLTDTAVAAANTAVTTPDATEAAVNTADTAATAQTGAGEAGISTGDESNMMVYGAVAAIAAVMLAGWFVVNRRRAN